ncbi:MAG: cob(I)yrinic acid a,c-diamide adenosyltransferase [Patescibacteria group bacterium]
MKIYTKTGDEGETSLSDGRRIGKSCLEMQVIGEIDELNAALGVVVAKMDEGNLRDFLIQVQKDLIIAGSEVASLQTPLNEQIEKLSEEKITDLEKWIDTMWSELPELKNFILSGGSEVGAYLHLARTVCRRAERQLVAFGKTAPIRPELYKYFNRLSDFLFVAARWVNAKDGVEEVKI